MSLFNISNSKHIGSCSIILIRTCKVLSWIKDITGEVFICSFFTGRASQDNAHAPLISMLDFFFPSSLHVHDAIYQSDLKESFSIIQTLLFDPYHYEMTALLCRLRKFLLWILRNVASRAKLRFSQSYEVCLYWAQKGEGTKLISYEYWALLPSKNIPLRLLYAMLFEMVL